MVDRSDEERLALLQQWKQLVRRFAFRYQRALSRWHDMDDLLAIGQMRLWEATKTWDPTLGASFCTHATYYIFGEYQRLVDYHRSAPHRGDMSCDSLDETEEDGSPKRQIQDPRLPIDDRADLSRRARRALVLLGKMSPRDQAVIRGRFMADRSLQEIGQEFGITRERARQIEQKILARLRAKLAGESSAPGPLSCKAVTAPARANRRLRKVASGAGVP